MGFAIASRLADGAEVTLDRRTSKLDTPDRVKRESISRLLKSLYEETMKVWPKADVGIACAAVADLGLKGELRTRRCTKMNFQTQ